MPGKASGIPTSSFDTRPHMQPEHDPAVPAQSASAFADLQRENSRLLADNKRLRKAITDISREIDDLVVRCGLVASGATAN